MTTKIDTCSICAPDVKGAIWEATQEIDWKAAEPFANPTPIWICCCCGTKKPRRVVKNSVRNDDGLTAAQVRAVERLKIALPLLSTDVAYNVEITTTAYGSIWLSLNTGAGEDDPRWYGDHWNIQIGVRGGAVAYTAPKWFTSGSSHLGVKPARRQR